MPDDQLTPEQQKNLIANARGEMKRLGEFIATKEKEFGIAPENGRGGSATPVTTLEQFKGLSPAERTQFYRDNPGQYSKFTEQIRKAGEVALFEKKAQAGL